MGSHSIAVFVMFGAICFKSSGHFPLKLYSNCTKPVALPPGRERLSTNPEPTGSGTFANTIGIILVAWSNGPTLAPPVATRTSGASVTSSAAYLRMSSALPAPQRYSTRKLRPSAQPKCCKPCRNAAMVAWPCGSSAASPVSTPMRRVCATCWACAVKGQPRPRLEGLRTHAASLSPSGLSRSIVATGARIPEGAARCPLCANSGHCANGLLRRW